jgi:hypothetical protein
MRSTNYLGTIDDTTPKIGQELVGVVAIALRGLPSAPPDPPMSVKVRVAACTRIFRNAGTDGTRRCVLSISHHCFVHVTPTPVLARFERLDYRVLSRVKMLSGVSIGRRGAAADVTSCKTALATVMNKSS